MKTILLAALLAVSARAVTMTANFDSLAPNTSVSSDYSENGIQLTSPTNLSAVSGSFGATLFGWGGYTYFGSALAVRNNGWVGITASGSLMDSVTFKYGFDWNGYTIEYGLMDVNVEWQALFSGQVVATGGLYFDREHRSHGGGMITANPDSVFDELFIRSTAVEYAPIAGTDGWYYNRGAIIGHGDSNRIAFDNVSVTTAQPAQLFSVGQTATVPDGGWTLAMLALTMIALMRRIR